MLRKLGRELAELLIDVWFINKIVTLYLKN
jgi:hypothetical protein